MDAQPIGTVHIKTRTTRKQIRRQRFIKVSHHGSYRNRWRPFARHWWEQHVGQIPAGCQVFHRDGDSLNDAPENLILTREQRFAQIFAVRANAKKNQKRRHAQAVIKSNRLRGQINASQMRPKSWYLILPLSRVIIWIPCRNPGLARRITTVELSEICHKDAAIIASRGGIAFQPEHPTEVIQGLEILRLSQPDSRLESFARIIPDTRREKRRQH